MADPIPYTPGFDYSAFEASSPTSPKPGAQLDNDFENIGQSIDSLVDSVTDIRRSDGALKNEIVTKDSLAPEIAVLLGASPDVDIITENIDDIITVADNIGDINTVADNIAIIQASPANAESAAESAELAEKWAENPRDVAVEPGKFSAMHWAEVAEEAASGGVSGVSSFNGRIGAVVPAASDYTAAQIARGGGTVEDALDALEAETFKLQTLATNYTALAVDDNSLFRFTAASTLALTAAATLGVNWHCTVWADGADVTIDPNGAETVNGVASIVVPNGNMVTLVNSGSAFFASGIPSLWSLVSLDAGAAVGPLLSLFRNSASPAAADVIGGISLDGRDSAGNKQTYAAIEGGITDPTTTSEDGALFLKAVVAGTLATIIAMNGTSVTVNGTLTVTG